MERDYYFVLGALSHGPTPGGVLPYMGYMGMCRCEGYGFQAVYSKIGYTKSEHIFGSRIGYHFSGN